ncbi:adenosine deaminase [Saccharopolyspora erythraea NRRL 2338]|uniref:Adenosine deaminase n=2 Tax=Saccharopolyspora erythraea TaxID=1836 RepID=A4FBR1_SACEN|nr:adenosine deaminase [Saccharopolyspora erythraea]EQD87556.1 adenosine deaminase [Saccharopolyspora erythraea D]PFG95264.1 adenosine deaminase [Saccharopolyspora erythraea NRRL 2338]QRK91914.1 adenosine deaminase [Saccharopolyspora erythraea]CAM01486.1 adenosine deaminase [Saccharopolyspora erythraea NRRL 2338]
MSSASIDQFIAALPKVELHVHLEGSMQPPLLLALAEKHAVAGFSRSLREIREWYEYRDFPHFLDVYRRAVEVLRDEEDFAALAFDTARNLAAQNVRYAEVHFSLSDHLLRDIPAPVVFAGIEHGRKRAERESGIRIRWIPDFAGDYGAEAGERTLDAVLAHGPQTVLGFGVGGLEVERDQFREVFARARAAGLHSLPHAGETRGPDRVWSAIRALGAERIGHGIGSVADAELIAHLRDTQLPVDVSPTSNLRTGAVRALTQESSGAPWQSRGTEHPLPWMLEEGLLVTLNSDDPPMFGTDLNGEYRAAHRMGLDRAALTRLARNGVRASFLPERDKTALLAEIDAVDPRQSQR